MKRFFMSFMGSAILLLVSNIALGGDFDGKKILYIDSYHEGYAWSDGMTEAIVGLIEGSGAELKIHRMDTKRNGSEAFKKAAALKAKAVIKSFSPDVVIATDDNASKYLIVPYYRGKSLPFVFAGVNWDAKPYGFPASNVTGMVEVNAYPDLISILTPLAKGKKIGFLTGPGTTGQLIVERSERILGLQIDQVRQASDFEQWKSMFKELNQKVDMILLNNNAGIKGWDDENAVAFVEKNTQVVTGTTNKWMLKYSVLAYAKLASEQGDWAAQTAMRILLGESPADIPIERNKRGDIGVNKRLARVLGVNIPEEVEFSASEVIE